MPLSLVRIDDRLIHGQVVEGWLPALSARRVLIVSDQAASDPTQAALMQMALPESVSLEICTVRSAPEAVRRAAEGPEPVLVLAPGPAEVLSLLEGGVALESVNVGGLHYAAGRVALGKALFLGEADLEHLRAIAKRGVRLEGRAVPTDPSEDILEIIQDQDKG